MSDIGNIQEKKLTYPTFFWKHSIPVDRYGYSIHPKMTVFPKTVACYHVRRYFHFEMVTVNESVFLDRVFQKNTGKDQYLDFVLSVCPCVHPPCLINRSCAWGDHARRTLTIYKMLLLQIWNRYSYNTLSCQDFSVFYIKKSTLWGVPQKRCSFSNFI